MPPDSFPSRELASAKEDLNGYISYSHDRVYHGCRNRHRRFDFCRKQGEEQILIAGTCRTAEPVVVIPVSIVNLPLSYLSLYRKVETMEKQALAYFLFGLALVVLFAIIIVHYYSKKRETHIEEAKYKMLDDNDDDTSRS
jgi:cbb3-type cytochrome oxidase subunit 3